MKHFFLYGATAALLTFTTSCSLFSRAREKAVEPPAPALEPLPAEKLSTAPQHIQAQPKQMASEQSTPAGHIPGPLQGTEGTSAPHPKIASAQALYDEALHEHQTGAYLKASDLWKRYLKDFAGMGGDDLAKYYLAQDYAYLGKNRDARNTIASFLMTTKDPVRAIDARILLSETLLSLDQFKEALAVTYEVLPDRAAEKRVGIQREADAIGRSAAITPTATQRVRLLTMRGRILASLDQQTDARAALTLARQELKATAAIPEAERPGLLANVAWRELETLSVYCQRKFPLPKRLSEAEFLAYARGYYECAGPARQLFCEVLAGKSEQIRSEALQTYQGFLENPLELARHLPPPSREVKKQEQRRYYEREMKALIENTVRSHTEEFRNLEICGAQKIF